MCKSDFLTYKNFYVFNAGTSWLIKYDLLVSLQTTCRLGYDFRWQQSLHLLTAHSGYRGYFKYQKGAVWQVRPQVSYSKVSTYPVTTVLFHVVKKPRGVGQPEGQNVQVTGIFLLEKERIYWKQSRIRFELTEGQRARNVSESSLQD